MAEAIKVANLILSFKEAEHVFLAQSFANSLSRDGIQACLDKVRVRWRTQTSYGMTPRRQNARTIWLKDVMRQRLFIIGSESMEKKRILFLMAVILLHELGHLILRWRGCNTSTSSLIEAGSSAETLLFGGVIRAKLKGGPLWDKTTQVVAILRHCPEHTDVGLNTILLY